MNTDELTILLTRADMPAPAPPLDERALAKVIQHRAARRSLARRASATCLAAMVALSLLIVTHRPTTHPPTVAPTINVAQLRAELLLLDAEAKLHEATARQMERGIATARRTAAAKQILASASVDDVQQHRERAAAILVYQAEKLALHPATKDSARQELQSAATLFPDTNAGRRARNFLDQSI